MAKYINLNSDDGTDDDYVSVGDPLGSEEVSVGEGGNFLGLVGDVKDSLSVETLQEIAIVVKPGGVLSDFESEDLSGDDESSAGYHLPADSVLAKLLKSCDKALGKLKKAPRNKKVLEKIGENFADDVFNVVVGSVKKFKKSGLDLVAAIPMAAFVGPKMWKDHVEPALKEDGLDLSSLNGYDQLEILFGISVLNFSEMITAVVSKLDSANVDVDDLKSAIAKILSFATGQKHIQKLLAFF